MKSQIVLVFNLLVVLATAQQNDYTVEYEKLEIVSYNKDIVENPVVSLFKYNETSQGVNASGVLKQDLGMDIKVNMDASRLQENGEYKQVAHVIEVDFCDLLNRNQFGLKDLLQYGNFTVCPWKQATYMVSNAMIDVTKLPPKAPAGKYVMNVHYFSGTTELLHTKFLGSVINKTK